MDSETELSAAVLTGYISNLSNPDQPAVEIEIVSPDFSEEAESCSDVEKAVEEPDGGVLDPPKSILKNSSSPAAVGEEGVVQVGIIVEDGGKKKGKKKQPKKKLVPIWRLFRFADCWDILMIIFGTIGACCAGVALPGHMLLFGRVINEFVTYSIAVSANLSSATLPTSSCSPASILNSTAYTEYLNASRVHFCFDSASASTGTDPITSNVLQYTCNPQETLQNNVGFFSIYYVVLATGVLIAIFFATIFWNLSAFRQTRRMRLAFYRAILHQEIGWFDVSEATQLNTRLVDDIEKIQSGIGDKLALFIQYITTFLAGYVIAFAINWKMALVVSVMLPLLVLMAFMIAKVIASFTAREQSAYAAAGAVAEEVISSIRTVVAFGGENRETERYGEQLKKARKEGFKKSFFSSIISGMLFVIIFGTYALGFGYGSTLILTCELSAGDIVTVFFAIIIGSSNLGNALPELETFASALGSATVVYEIIDRDPLIDSFSDDGIIPDEFEGNIKLSDVVFHYPARPSVQVLHGLDLEVRKGQTVALVGASGCGKSTVVQLIQRLYDTDAGQITIDGHDVQSLNLKWLRNNIGVVSQEPVLFNTTIAGNIRYGKKDATMEEIIEAAKNANAHDFISELPDGYDTDVGERGAQLSGGQKQRIAIARALVRDPKVLLLDEATSALDNESEKIVQDALDKAREGRTTIVIAHRLSTIQTADIIISIEKGRVVEMGSHADLMDREGLYFELVTAQTIVEEEEDSQEPLADFKAAVKRSISRQHSDSTTSKDRPSFSRQSPHQHSHHDSSHLAPGLTDHLSQFSVDDLPFVSSPSPHPGRATFPGPDECVSDKSDSEESEYEDEDEKAVRFEDNSVEIKDSAGPCKRSSSIAKNISRKKKKDHNVPKVSFLELLKLNQPDWYIVLVGVIGSAVMGCLFPLMSLIFSDVLRVFGLPDRQQVMEETLRVVGSFLGMAAGAGLVQFISSFTLNVAGERLTKRMRYLSFQAMLRQEIGWFDKKSNSTGALTTKLATDASEVKGATGIRLGVILQQVFGFVAALAVAFSASWELTLLLVFCFPVLVIVGFFQIKLVSGKAAKNKKGIEAAGQIAVESIDNIRTVVALGIEPRFYDSYKEELRKPFRNNIKSVFVQGVVLGIAQSTIFYLFAAVPSFGAFLVILNRATYDQIFRVFAAVVFTALSIGRASSFAPDASKAKVSAGRVMALLRRTPAIDSTSKEGEKPETTTGAVSLKHVHFNYPERPEVKVLQGLSVSVKPGQTLALVGPSGCGKSTTVSLIERFYDPATGSVSLDDVNLRDLNIQWLRSKVGIVSQEPVLFDASVADNIRYGALFRDVSDEEIVEAAKAANIHSFIESLPMGYSTNVGSKGTQLSGGQKQRVAIARALVRDPKVLLLDEATSALDTESEKIVQDALDKAREGRTSIVIAHRLSTIYNSDVIAVIHGGQVIESGTHTELMALGGAYYHLNTVQLMDID